MDKWLFAVMALEVFARNVWPDDDDLIAKLEPYVIEMRADYEARKWKAGFLDASRAAQVSFLKKIESEGVTPSKEPLFSCEGCGRDTAIRVSGLCLDCVRRESE